MQAMSRGVDASASPVITLDGTSGDHVFERLAGYAQQVHSSFDRNALPALADFAISEEGGADTGPQGDGDARFIADSRAEQPLPPKERFRIIEEGYRTRWPW